MRLKKKQIETDKILEKKENNDIFISEINFREIFFSSVRISYRDENLAAEKNENNFN